tara:strand:- start:5789 stop:6760 length:972 start_codon:yes stop_codon:yes gene_type:complete
MVRVLAVAVLAVALLGGATARADDMDPALYRLRIDGGDGTFSPDQAAFARLTSQLGFAVAAPVTTGAATTGTQGFYVGFETSIASIDDGADYWRLGTEGNGGADENRFVNGSLVSSRLHVRKGLPFGIEIGLEGGHFYDSSLWVWGADLKIAILEGFREGWQAILPDIAVRGTVRSLAGARDLQLTVPSFDVIVSKRLVLGKVLELTPMVAAQFFWIAADSEVVDLTPGTDAYAACDPVATPDPESPPLACQGDTSDLANNRSFDELRAFRSRLALGLSGRYRYLSLGVTFHIDLLDPSNADDDVPDDVRNQWDLTVSVAARY